MSDKLNNIAKYEVAISKKYGKETIKHPKADWDDEKEKDYQQQIKDLYQKEKKQEEKNMAKFDCCFKCFIQWIEGREDRWKTGWRPDKKE